MRNETNLGSFGENLIIIFLLFQTKIAEEDSCRVCIHYTYVFMCVCIHIIQLHIPELCMCVLINYVCVYS